MGLFEDSFDIGAGATLGNLAVKTGYEATQNFLNAAEQKAYNNLRSEKFDPVVRQDLNDVIVRGMLQATNYPFPKSNDTKKPNFFVRHKVFWIVFAIYFVMGQLSLGTGIVSMGMMTDVSAAFIIFTFVYIIRALFKKTKRGAKKVLEAAYKPKLINDGNQYWYVREHVRQALAMGQMNVQTAIVKISNTELGRQFPDTVDEIEANAFYYRQRLNSFN